MEFWREFGAQAFIIRVCPSRGYLHGNRLVDTLYIHQRDPLKWNNGSNAESRWIVTHTAK